MIHAVGEPKSIREHNFFQVHSIDALNYSLWRCGAWCCRVEADALREDQSLGVGGTLLTAYEANNVAQLRQLCSESEPIVVPDAVISLPESKGPTQLAIGALDAAINSGELDTENRGLAALYQWHLATNPQPIQSIVELDRVLPFLLLIGIRNSKQLRPLLTLKKLLEPVVRRLK